MFFQALSSMKEIFNEKSSDNQESIQMVNKTLALNDCELIVGQALPVLKLNNKVQGFDQFDIPSSLFPSEKAFNIAAKESEEALGVSLNLLGDHFMDKTSYFKLVDNEVTPSILRFIETSIENVK